MIDRLLLLSTHSDLGKIPWLSPHDTSLEFIPTHIEEIKKDNLHILMISNCEILLFIIRKWDIEPFFTKKEIFNLYKASKRECFDNVIANFLVDVSFDDAQYLWLTLRLIKKLNDSEYQSDLYRLLLPPFTTGEIIDHMIESLSEVERKLYPDRFNDNVPKLLVNSESIKLSNIELEKVDPIVDTTDRILIKKSVEL